MPSFAILKTSTFCRLKNMTAVEVAAAVAVALTPEGRVLVEAEAVAEVEAEARAKGLTHYTYMSGLVVLL